MPFASKIRSVSRSCVVSLGVVLMLTMISNSFAQNWRKSAPDEIEQIPSFSGNFINFPNVVLPVGARYHVHASLAAQTSNNGDSNDAMYYFNGQLRLLPNSIFPTVGMKIRYDGTNDNWFSNPTVIPAQAGYQSTHVYDAGVLSKGAALGFRFFDRQDPPSTYYNDNHGVIAVEVTQESPAIASFRDTLDFGAVGFRFPSSLPDSIEAYGTEALNVTSVEIIGSNAFTFQSQRGNSFSLPDQATNAFTVSFAPKSLGNFQAELHIHSTNGLGGDSNRVIVLLGSGHGAVLSDLPDTLDFQSVGVLRTSTLSETLKNTGDSGAQVVASNIVPAGLGFSVNGLPVSAVANGSTGVSVSFKPPVVGAALAKITLSLDNGGQLTFFVKGFGTLGILYLSADTLNFGTVLFGDSKTLTDTMLNIGQSDLTISSITNSNPAEFSVVGNLNPRVVAALGSGDVYTVTFTPITHIANFIHVAYLTFTYDGGATRTVTLIGREHTPLDAFLRIDTNYFGKPGGDVTISQKLTTDLSGTAVPITDVQEKILYNSKVLSYSSAAKASVVSSSDWTLTASNPTPGEVDIHLHSTKSGLAGPGPLVSLQFHVLESALPSDTSHLTQVGVNMGGGLEPLITLSQGKLTVLDGCTPLLLVGSIATSVEPNSPNPFRESTTLKYWVNEPSRGAQVRMRLFDALGNEVGTLVDREIPNGEYKAVIDGSKLVSGVYTVLFEAGAVRTVSHISLTK